MPEVAICIPTFNQAQYLGQTLETALIQNDSQCEIWVSDDASTDATPEVMRHYLDHPRVHYHRHERNLGMVRNSAWVVGQPQTEFIVKLDSDDLLEPNYVATLVGCMQQAPLAGYAHAAVQEIDQFGRHRRARFLARAAGYQTPEDSLHSLVSGLRVAANTCLFRRSVIEQLGFYRTELIFAEDWDLAVRIADAGWGNVYCACQLSSYRVWTDAGQVRARRKLVEVEGCRQMLAESLEPAFRRRGWSLSPIQARRRVMAATHASAIASSVFTPAEKAALIQSLRALGDGPRLRSRLLLIRLGLGCTLTFGEAAKLRAKDAIKSLMRFRLFR